jgi:AcrR family transcriptional regulator
MNELSSIVGGVGRPRVASRQTILDATLEIFRERGYEGTTIPAIAERCGISQGTVYNYFPSKEKLLFACARAGGTPGAIFTRLRADVGRRPVAELLEEAAVGVTRFLELRLPAVLMRAARPAVADRPGVEYPRRGVEAVRDYFAAEMRAGRVRSGDPHVLALGFLGGIFYEAFFERVYGLPASFRLDREGFARTWARHFAETVTPSGRAHLARRRSPRGGEATR